jgi:hypothetical protein
MSDAVTRAAAGGGQRCIARTGGQVQHFLLGPDLRLHHQMFADDLMFGGQLVIVAETPDLLEHRDFLVGHSHAPVRYVPDEPRLRSGNERAEYPR